MHPLAATRDTGSFEVQWSGSDTGAGIGDYTIFVSENGGAFTPFVSNTTETAATFTGAVGKRYAFYSIARDLVGNEELPPASPDTVTRVGAQDCAGDCDDGGTVTVNELIVSVNVALGTAAGDPCPSFDTDANGSVTINEIVAAVGHALAGC